MDYFRPQTALALLVGASVLAASTPAGAADPIKIGALIELSGRFVSFGSHCQRGINMATEAFGDTVAGKKYQIEYRDVQSEVRATISAFTELGSAGDTNFVIGPISSPIAAAAIPPWQQSKPLWIVPGASTLDMERLVGQEPMFFHTYPYAYHYHKSLAAALKASLGEGRKLAVLYSDDSYGRSHVPAIEKYYKEAGFDIVAMEAIRTNSSDMGPTLTKIARAKPDILLGIVQTTDAITLAKQARTLRLKIPYLVGTAATQLTEWQQAVGDAQEGWLGISTYLPGNENWPADETYPKLLPSTKTWEAEFDAKYHATPDYDDITCYANTIQLLQAMQNAGSDDKEKVAAALRTLDVMTPMGRGHFEQSEGTKQQAFSDLIVFQRQGGRNVVLYPPKVATGELKAAP